MAQLEKNPPAHSQWVYYGGEARWGSELGFNSFLYSYCSYVRKLGSMLTSCFFPWGENTLHLKTTHSFAVIHKTRRSKQNYILHSYYRQSKIRLVCTQSGLLLCLSSYVRSENVSFPNPKVLAEGQTSGSGGGWKKLALITMRGNGLSMVVGNPKRMRVLPCF